MLTLQSKMLITSIPLMAPTVADPTPLRKQALIHAAHQPAKTSTQPQVVKAWMRMNMQNANRTKDKGRRGMMLITVGNFSLTFCMYESGVQRDFSFCVSLLTAEDASLLEVESGSTALLRLLLLASTSSGLRVKCLFFHFSLSCQISLANIITAGGTVT